MRYRCVDLRARAVEKTGLNGRTERNDLVRVDSDDRRPTEELLHFARHHGHSCSAADEDDAIELARLRAGGIERLLTDSERPFDQRERGPLELGALHLELPLHR